MIKKYCFFVFTVLLLFITSSLFAHSTLSNPRPYRVAILIFDGVETLDFTGPLEVFSNANDNIPKPLFKVYTVSPNQKMIKTRDGLPITADYSISDSLKPDILVIPGGAGVEQAMQNKQLIAWVKAQSAQAHLVLSVCSGALILADAGVLRGLNVTTHHSRLLELKALSPTSHIIHDVKYIDNGKVVLSAGVSSGIDMTLHIVQRLAGKACALKTAQDMEYSFH